MKNLKKKLAMAILSGVIMAGTAVTSFAAEAADDAAVQEPSVASVETKVEDVKHHQKGHRPSWANHEMDSSFVMNEAEKLAKDFGVARADVVTYLQKGVHLREIHHACMISKVSGKSLNDVMAVKEGRHWPEVEKTLGVTREDLRAQMRELMAVRVAEDAHSDVKTVAKLLADKYNPRDIEIAGIISYESGKSIQSVLKKKTVNKGWWDVAKDCGVTYDQVVANHSGHNHMTFNEHKHGGHPKMGKHNGGHSNMSRHHGGPRK